MSESGVDRVLARAVAERGRTSSPSEARVQRLKRAAALAGLLVAASGLTVAAAWLLDLRGVTGLGPGSVTIKLSTALCLTAVGAGIAVSAGTRSAGGRARARVVAALVVPVVAVALLTLVEDAVGLTLPVDNPFGLDPGDPGSPVPGRMAQMTAVSLLVLSSALLLSARRRPRAAQAAAMVALAIGMTSLVGYSYGVEGLYAVGPFNIMAMPTALLVASAAVGVLLLRPDEGYVAVGVGNTAGGEILRKVLPGAVLGPYLIGAVIVVGVHQGRYDGESALASFVIAAAAIGAGLVWFQAERLRDVDLRRGGAEDALQVAREALAERDRIEAELAANVRRTYRILATAADAYIAIDTDGRVTDWNDAAVAVFGWTRGEAIGARLDRLIIPDRHQAAHRAGLAAFLATGETHILGQRLEMEARTRTGSRIPVELTVWAEQEDSVAGFHAFVRDISSRKRDEQHLRRLNADLAEFAAIAAHDLRSPLATIQMQVDLVLGELDGGSGPEEARAWVERIGRTAARGVSLIDDLLAYVSIGRESQVAKPVDLETLVGEIVDAEVGAAGRPVTCTVGSLPVVAGDPSLLRQLVANLIGNAIKYVPKDRTPTVVVDAVTAPGAQVCMLRVGDNGDGFDAEDRDRVFDMFQRGRGSSGVPGTGIGLAICRRVAERHGGRIWVDPETTSGSRLCVELPLWAGRLSSAADPGSTLNPAP